MRMALPNFIAQSLQHIKLVPSLHELSNDGSQRFIVLRNSIYCRALELNSSEIPSSPIEMFSPIDTTLETHPTSPGVKSSPGHHRHLEVLSLVERAG
jgi:hypothetical protein